MQTLYGRSHSASATVSRLDPIYIYIIVCKHGTTHGRDAHGLILQAHLVDNLGNEIVHRTVTTTRAVVHNRIGNQTRTRVYLILLSYLYFCHSALLYKVIFKCLQNLVGSKYHATRAAIMLDRSLATYGQAYILDHLTGIHLHRHKALDATLDHILQRL